MLHANQHKLGPRVKHVTNIARDVHTKINDSQKNGYHSGSFRVIRIPGEYSHSGHMVNTSGGIVRSNTFHVNHGHARTHHHFPQTAVHTWTFAEPSNKHVNVTNTGHSNSVSDSLAEQQRVALEQLDLALGSDKDDKESDTSADTSPRIEVDVLPEGVFESIDPRHVVFGDEEDSSMSRHSSVSEKSESSKSGIISSRHSIGSAKRKNRPSSVSFSLPEGHVDKPYQPLNASQKQRPVIHEQNHEQSSPPSSIIIRTGDVKLSHTGNGVIVENRKGRRLSGGPFKGSFKDLFYGKFSNDLLGEYKNSGRFLTPPILEKVESFENVHSADQSYPSSQSGAVPGIIRRHTFR